MKTSGITYTIIFSFIATFLFVTLLSLANAFTIDKIEANQKLSLQKAVLRAAAVPFASDTEATTLYSQDVTVPLTDNPNLFIIKQTGSDPVYALRFSGQGLWGTITGILAVDRTLTKTIGVDIISHNETPGLGGRIAEDYYKAQFQQEKISADNTIKIAAAGPGDPDHNNSQVDAISGASQTSKLFGVIINRTLAQLKTMLNTIGGNR